MTLFPPFPPCSHSGGNTFLRPNSLLTDYLLLLVLPCSHCSQCFEIRDFAQCAGAGARARASREADPQNRGNSGNKHLSVYASKS
jgi:hypothetical protein